MYICMYVCILVPTWITLQFLFYFILNFLFFKFSDVALCANHPEKDLVLLKW